MFELRTTKYFDKALAKLIKKNRNIYSSVEFVLMQLLQDPFALQLKTHKVDSRLHKDVFSSKVTGDIRIIWTKDQDNKVILILLEIGGHSGKNKVYK
jgi:mRNA-degrading endonuclease YafQ of YafQ-DinJ toxin-antitoxin module